MSDQVKPVAGMLVRLTLTNHPKVPQGRCGVIDTVIDGDDFWVVTDCGGFFGWTGFASWEPIQMTPIRDVLGHRWTWAEFVHNCHAGLIIDYDGWGRLATDDACSDVSVIPSEITGDGYVKPPWATQVYWHNR